MSAKKIAIIVLVGLAAVFFIQNVAVVELRFLFWTISIPAALLMFFLLLVGIFLGWWVRGIFSRKKGNVHTKHTVVVAE